MTSNMKDLHPESGIHSGRIRVDKDREAVQLAEGRLGVG